VDREHLVNKVAMAAVLGALVGCVVSADRTGLAQVAPTTTAPVTTTAPTLPPSTTTTTEPATTTTTAPPARHLRSTPPTPPGARPPQFVVVSFDGTGGQPLFSFWRDVGRRTGARFTFFLSGVYLLATSTRGRYHPPGRPAGSSDIGFNPAPRGADPMAEIAALLANLQGAWWDGHEIGTHYNGHFCGPRGVDRWTEADWTQEIAEFNRLLTDVATNNPLPADHTRLGFGPADILGGRTPCLEGNKPAVHAAAARAGHRYDASGTTRQFTWPTHDAAGLWDMSVASVPIIGRGSRALLMDYNLYTAQSNAKPGPAAQFAAWRQQARDTFQRALDDAYTGNRAPVIIGNHFEDWNGRIYTDALADFIADNCNRPEVVCASHEELTHWLDSLPPGALDSFQAGAFPHAG
jgi:hypothetical protein